MLSNQAPQLTVNDMFNVVERNHHWQRFKYEMPSPSHGKTTLAMISSAKAGQAAPRKNYLDDLQRQKATIPAPNQYINDLKVRPKSGKIDKSKRMTLTEETVKMANRDNVPGPAAYFQRPKSAINTFKSESGTRSPAYGKGSRQKQHYLHEVLYVAANNPGVGAYNIRQASSSHIPTVSWGKRPASAVNLGRAKNQSKSSKKLIKQKNGLPLTAAISGTFAYLQSHRPNKSKNSIGRQKRFKMGSEVTKQPGPNSYKLNCDWVNKKSLLKQVSSTQVGIKSVYYG